MAENTQENSQERNPADHLKPHRWGKGFCPNPGGRPKKKPITEAYERLLETQPELANEIAQAVVKQAIKGNTFSLKEMTERVEGKVADKLEVTGHLEILAERISRARSRTATD